MRKIRMGIIGLGNRGAYISQNIIAKMPQYEITAVCDKHQKSLENAAAVLNNPNIGMYADYEIMLKNGCMDAVYVVTDPCSQCELICASLYSGRHVICDVPLSYRLRDCWNVVIAVEKTGLKFQMGEQLRFCRFVNEAKQYMAEGKLGKILYAEGQYIHNDSGKRIFWDTKEGKYLSAEEAERNPYAVYSNRLPLHPITYCPHELSPILKILDDRVHTVTCVATHTGGYKYRIGDRSDMELAVMHTYNDTIIRILNCFSIPDPGIRQHWYHIMGTEGQIEMKRAGWDKGKVWFDGDKNKDYTEIDYDLYRIAGQEAEQAKTAHFGLDYHPFATFAKSILDDTDTDMDVYNAAESSAPGIVAGISSEYDGLPFEVPDFRPGLNRKNGQEPATFKARSLYGGIEREAAIFLSDGRRSEQ